MNPNAASSAPKQRPRIRRWQLILWIALIGFFTVISIHGQHGEGQRKERDVPIQRYLWNAVTIHTGPFAGMLYWDWGYHDVSGVITHGARTRMGGGDHQAYMMGMACLFVTVVAVNAGIIPRAVSRWVRGLYGVLFVLGLLLWYYSATLSYMALM